MLTANQRSALAALDIARPIVARLDAVGHPEELAADLIESWSAVETALRSLVGGSALGGQALIGDLRQRNLLTINQAHALLEYLATRDRASRPEYRPDAADVAAARAGFQTLEAALGVGIGADTAMFAAVVPGRPAPPGAAAALAPPVAQTASAHRGASAPSAPLPADEPDPIAPPADGRRRGGRQPWLFPVIAIIGALVAIGGALFVLNGSRAGERALARGRDAYRDGRREVARREFEEAAKREARLAEPHVYLARLAREDGDLPRAQRELDAAVRLEPNNHLALREMGQLTLQASRPDLAVRFLTRALQANPGDSAAMGWLGCALVRQGRPDLAQSWFQRAGQGGWTACAGPAPGAPGGAPVAGAPGVGAPGYPPPAGAPRPF